MDQDQAVVKRLVNFAYVASKATFGEQIWSERSIIDPKDLPKKSTKKIVYHAQIRGHW